MRITDLMERLAALFPNRASEIEAWAQVYRANLREGPDLEAALNSCLSEWGKATPPKPKEIAAYLPQRGLSGGGSGPVVERHDHLSAKWANRVMRADPGAKAVQHGFARELYLWAEKHHGQWPDDDALRRLYQAEQRHQRRVAALRDEQWDGGDGLRASCLRLAEAMDHQNERLCQRYGAIHDQEAA